MRSCPQCGAAADASVKFCADCGAPIPPLPAEPAPRLPRRILRTVWPDSTVSVRREVLLIVLYAVVLILLLSRLASR